MNPLWEDIKLGDTPIGPAGEDSGFPAVTLNQYGKGKVAFISGDIFSYYWKKNNHHLKYLIKNLVDLVTEEKIIEVIAPPSIEVSLFQKDGKKIIHLVNSHVEKVVKGGASFAESIPPVFGIKIRLKVEKMPKSISQQPENRKIEFVKKGDYIECTIPRVNIHSVIIVQ